MRERVNSLGRLMLCGCAVIALGWSVPAHSAEGSSGASKIKPTLTVGYNHSSGDYGQTEDTVITYIPVTAKIKKDRWTAKLTVPYIKIKGPGVVAGGEDTSVGGVAQPVGTESGMGDVQASLSYKQPLGGKGIYGDLMGKVKIPTADEDRNLGTGEFDYTLQAGLTKTIGDAYVTGSVGRKFNGSSSTFSPNDVWKASAGAGYNFTPQLTAGASYDWRESSSDTGEDYSNAIGYGTYKMTKNWEAQVYAGTGFSDAAPNFSTGLQVSYKFDAVDLASDD